MQSIAEPKRANQKDETLQKTVSKMEKWTMTLTVFSYFDQE